MSSGCRPLRVVEFYSGIGGMHYALKASGLKASVVAAIDVNDLANSVYRHNFPHVNLMQRNVQSVTKVELDELNADMFLMSPPCQPFTRVGLKGDTEDPRAASFLKLLATLPKLAKRPNYLLVENVQGFETSQTRNHLLLSLEQSGYRYQEFLLSPVHFGIPNQRLRYFLVAKHRPLEFISPANLSVGEHEVLRRRRLHVRSPDACCRGGESTSDGEPASTDHRSQTAGWGKDGRDPETAATHAPGLGPYLEELSPEGAESFVLPDKVLGRFARIVDVVTVDGDNTRCFTKSYGHYAEGTGSLLQMSPAADGASILKNCKKDVSMVTDEYMERLRSLRIRYFTPREVANLHHLPPNFEFPKDLSRIQRYRCLGNSLNVHVVCVLLRYLATDPSGG